MVCRLRSYWYFLPITTFQLSANTVTVLVRLLYCMNLSDPEATLCTLRHGIWSSFYIKLHMGRMTRLDCEPCPSVPVRFDSPPQTDYRYRLIGRP